MIKKKQKKTGPIEIDLTGPDGNAFVLLGLAQKLARQLGYQPKERGDITAEMMSGDYEHLVETFDKHFGDYVILYR